MCKASPLHTLAGSHDVLRLMCARLEAYEWEPQPPQPGAEVRELRRQVRVEYLSAHVLQGQLDERDVLVGQLQQSEREAWRHAEAARAARAAAEATLERRVDEEVLRFEVRALRMHSG